MAVSANGRRSADVSVVIVNYNTREHLDECLRTVLAERPAEVVVVDNASPDGSAAMVRERYPTVRVLANDRNLGYGAAANVALRSTAAPFVLLLNADTRVGRGAIEKLAKHGRRHARAAVIAPAILDAAGQRHASYFPFPGTLAWLLENAPLSWVVRRVPALVRRSVSLRQPDRPCRVPWVLGCAMLLRRDALAEVGGFDERYFLYFEEVDLCQRLAERGWEVHFAPGARVRHDGGASTSQQRTAALIRHYDSTLIYYRRYYHGARLAFWESAIHVKRLALLARDSARLVTKGDPSERRSLEEQREAWLDAIARWRRHRRRAAGRR